MAVGKKTESSPFQVDAAVESEEEANPPEKKATSLKRVSSLPAAEAEPVFLFRELLSGVLLKKTAAEFVKGLVYMQIDPPFFPFPPTGVIFRSQPISLALGSHRCVPQAASSQW